MKKIKWGIISTGFIAHKMTTALKGLDDCEVVAVGSRSQDSADQFAAEYGIPKAYASYEELAADPDIDVIYVGTPHPYHLPNTLMCLDAGKHVLCEKPFALNYGEAKQMVDLAREKRLFLMEAMWTRFQPIAVKVRELLQEGAIGEVRMFQASFGFRAPDDVKHRAVNLELGGGALLDVGIYPLSYAYMVMGKPVSIMSKAHIGPTGADEENAIILSHEGGKLSVLNSGVRTQTEISAIIYGSTGYIKIRPPFFMAEQLEIHRDNFFDQRRRDDPRPGVELITLPHKVNGYEYQAMAVHDAIRNGKTESDVISLDESLEIMQAMDDMRAEWGLKYPSE